MSHSTIRMSLLALSAIGIIGISGAQASADHVRYGLRSERHGFSTESHLFHALEFMEQAYQARNLPRLSRVHAYQALSELRISTREVESSRARQYLALSQEDLRKFMLSGRLAELDHAAGHVMDAIRAEQSLRSRRVHDHHHGHGHSVGRPDWGHRPGASGPVWVQPRQQQHGSVLQIGGDWGGVRIRF